MSMSIYFTLWKDYVYGMTMSRSVAERVERRWISLTSGRNPRSSIRTSARTCFFRFILKTKHVNFIHWMSMSIYFTLWKDYVYGMTMSINLTLYMTLSINLTLYMTLSINFTLHMTTVNREILVIYNVRLIDKVIYNVRLIDIVIP
jgi:hypothetical protein